MIDRADKVVPPFLRFNIRDTGGVSLSFASLSSMETEIASRPMAATRREEERKLLKRDDSREFLLLFLFYIKQMNKMGEIEGA